MQFDIHPHIDGLRVTPVENPDAVQALEEALQVTMPPEYRELYAQYALVEVGGDEFLGPEQCGDAIEALSGTQRKRHHVPILADGNGGYYLLVAAPRKKKMPADFGAVLYFDHEAPGNLQRVAGSLLSFIKQRCQTWREDHTGAEEIVPVAPEIEPRRESIDDILARLVPTERGWQAALPERFRTASGETSELLIAVRSEVSADPPPAFTVREKQLARTILSAWGTVYRAAWAECVRHGLRSEAFRCAVVIERDVLDYEGSERWKLVFRNAHEPGLAEVHFDGLLVHEVRTVRA